MSYQYETWKRRTIRKLKITFTFAIFVAMFILMLANLSHAASLRVCVVNNTSANVATAPVFINGNPLHPDMLVGSDLAGTKRCSNIPLPATLARGEDFATTVKYANAIGEVSAPSNAVPFRLPGTPPVPVLDSVSIVVP